MSAPRIRSQSPPDTIVTGPKIEHHRVALGIGNPAPRLSWQVTTTETGWRQAAYEIEGLSPDGARRWGSGRIESAECVLVTWPGPVLRSREQVGVRVRVWGQGDGHGDGEPTPWSEITPVEVGLLSVDDWSAGFVAAPEPEAGPEPPTTPGDLPPVLMRRDFAVAEGLLRARVHATACGVYELEINGVRVGDQVLSPGWTSYHNRLAYQTYDVTAHLKAGPNALGGYLGDGWYRGRFGWNQVGERYGARTALLVQLELEYADGRRELVVTDEAWTCAAGPITRASIYDGERYDARAERAGWSSPGGGADWTAVQVIEPEVGALVAPLGPPVRRMETVAAVSVEQLPDGTHLLDFGQNLVGRLRLRLQGPGGTVIGLRHAEVIQNGRLCTRPMRNAQAFDEYVLRGDGPESWEPRFTYHGFRYAEITGWPGELTEGDVVAVVCHDDMPRTGWFTSSDPDLNRLHENVVWSMKGNFVSIPTDCPQRDERLGWTGDLQVFAPTASFLFDSAGSIADWLHDVAAETGADGQVPLYVPHITTSFPQFHCAVWGDVTTVVPLSLLERTGDSAPVTDGYETARAWVEGCSRLLNDQDVIAAGPQLGDWLDPAAPPDRPHEGTTDPYLVATAYLVHSARLLSRQAQIVGKPGDVERYAALADRVAAGFRREFVTASGRCASDSQTAYALALRFDLLSSPQQRTHAGTRLRQLAVASEHRIGTGFAGTPIILDALTEVGEFETAYRLLLERGCPSWLYPITMGATTIWERWDSMLPDGSVNPGDMTSFNHYALGAVADWLHRVLAGLAPAAAGYRSISVRPRPGGGISAAGARHLTPYGCAEVTWTRTGGELRVEVTVPPNTTAVIDLPGTEVVTVGSGDHVYVVAYRAVEDDPTHPLPPRPRF